MKSKLFCLVAFGILTIFLVGLASAAITFSNVPTLSQEGSSFTIKVTTNENETIDFTASAIDDGYGNQITFTPNSTVSFTAGIPRDVIIDYTVETDFDFRFGEEYFTTLTADGTEDATQTLYFEKVFCDYGNPADLDVKIEKIKVIEGFGDDDEYWYPLDEVEIDVKVENEGDWDVENIEIEFCLYDSEEKECILDEGDIDISEDDFDLDKGDDITTTLSFKVDPDDLIAGDTEYKIYVKAIGQIDDSDADEFDEEYTCDSDFIDDDFEIITDDKFVILDNVEIPEITTCGEKVELTADVWNVGDEDIDDDEIFLRIYNSELGINKVIEFTNGIDLMDYETISFTFDIPEDAKEKTHSILVTAYDDEDLYDKHIYENKEEDKAEYKVFIGISDCFAEPEVSVSATLESEAKAGEEMKIKIILGNLGSDTRTFMVDVENYGAWAELSESPGTLTLNSGSSGETYVNLDVDKDASSGEKTFNILVYEGTELIKTQPISVNIESRNFLGITGFSINEGNGYLWGLGLLNVILVIVIIIVAVRVARRK